MNVGVTGASGFLGRHIVAALRAAKMSVRSFARDARSLEGDAESFDLAHAAEARYTGLDAVVHAAAHIPQNFEDTTQARACLEANVIGTLDTLRGAHAAGVRVFVYISAGNAYTSLDRAATESDALYPSRAACYLESKICGEVLADAFARTHSVRAVHLRPSAIFGPDMRPSALIPSAVTKFLGGQRVVLRSGGTHEADLVFVDDVANATVSALQRDVSGPFNIGGGARYSMLQVVRTLADVMGVSPDLIDIEPTTEPASGFPALDIQRAATLLGFQPRSLRAGLEGCVRATST